MSTIAKITVNRIASDEDSTISVVNINDSFECFALEDQYNEHKIACETRIPAGLYRCGVRSVGGFNYRYKHKFPELHRGMIQVLNVPGYEYILIHIGNTDDDTAGCLLIGKGAMAIDGDMSIQHSTKAYIDFYAKVIGAALDDRLMIEYIDSDNAY